MDLNMCPRVLFMYSIRADRIIKATERDWTKNYSVYVQKKLTSYGGVVTDSHVTVWVNAAVP